MEGWWCVRYGDSLAWVEAPTAAAAVQRSLGLHPLGDWTDDTAELVVFPQDAYPENTGAHDYTRAVLNANPPPKRRRAGPGKPRPAHPLGCFAVVGGPSWIESAWRVTWCGGVCGPRARTRSWVPYTVSGGAGGAVSAGRSICGRGAGCLLGVFPSDAQP